MRICGNFGKEEGAIFLAIKQKILPSAKVSTEKKYKQSGFKSQPSKVGGAITLVALKWDGKKSFEVQQSTIITP